MLADLALPLLRCLDPETAHRLTIRALSLGLGPSASGWRPDPKLGQDLLGLHFPHPVGIAAGFDKDAEAYAGALRLGAAFVEVGTMTPRAQPGNPRPRLFRLPEDLAVVNRNGFNNQGLASGAARLTGRVREEGIVGANVGANKGVETPESDYAAGVAAMAPIADYITINVSSPNTPGLRDLQAPGPLRELLRAAKAARREVCGEDGPAILLKIAPDLEDAQLDGIVAVVLEEALDGMIVSNTTIARPDGLKNANRSETGGLSGAPLFGPSTEILRKTYRLTGGRIPLIGVGGVDSGATAYAKIKAGASLVQLYTALIYKGPGLVRRIAEELGTLLERDGCSSLAEAVGAETGAAP
ncbi:quinone-dependent dihydroorotate dehydrogenase [Nisaea acidiphila]|uniref:Dihydroorotate dehydrogenase (quinone) n=1 Tax=Nisaea acidiphila TaxID=1862145 RepID=A0A9J7AV75_9PROT|nr:quinone-dependent dihydroorotate dehydrogenase [Nisaea acidiphila]UUX51667.1 quinone-dependent dihydroorotate dehydrogenase [Nisaea acidiphila]